MRKINIEEMTKNNFPEDIGVVYKEKVCLKKVSDVEIGGNTKIFPVTLIILLI